MDMKLCDECKTNQANIHLTQIVQNEVTVLHLCEECAKKKGISIVIEENKTALPDNAGIVVEGLQPEVAGEIKLVCSECRMSFNEFKEKGWLGCSHCYTAFEKEIDTLLIQVHGTCNHKGKQYRTTPYTVDDSDDLMFLRKELDNAICNEKFELAAAIRDKINSVSSNESLRKGQK